MLKRLSGADDAQLTYYLARIREIASLGDEAALIETDKLLWEILEESEGLESSSEYFGEEHTPASEPGDWLLSRIQEAIDRVQRQLDEDTYIGFHDIVWLRRMAASEPASHLRPELWERVRERIEPLSAEANVLADRAEAIAFERFLEGAQEAPLANINSVMALVGELDHHVHSFRAHHEFTDEISRKVRRVKERAAWSRARKKLARAEVAEAGGQRSRATGLKKEAAALLIQDWAAVFPGEDPPEPDWL